MYPYKMMLVQELCEKDKENRRILWVDIQHFSHAGFAIFIHEVHFHLYGSVNKQNYRYRSQKTFVTCTNAPCIVLM